MCVVHWYFACVMDMAIGFAGSILGTCTVLYAWTGKCARLWVVYIPCVVCNADACALQESPIQSNSTTLHTLVLTASHVCTAILETFKKRILAQQNVQTYFTHKKRINTLKTYYLAALNSCDDLASFTKDVYNKDVIQYVAEKGLVKWPRQNVENLAVFFKHLWKETPLLFKLVIIFPEAVTF